VLYQERFSLIAKGRDFVLSLLLLLPGWQCIIWLTGVPRYILPPPLLVAQTFIDHAALICKHGKVTAIEVVAGPGIGLVPGLATAPSVMYYATARRLMMPTVFLNDPAIYIGAGPGGVAGRWADTDLRCILMRAHQFRVI